MTWIFVLLRPRWHPACSASLQPCTCRLCDSKGGDRPEVAAFSIDDKRVRNVECSDLRTSEGKLTVIDRSPVVKRGVGKTRLAHWRTRLFVVPSSEMSPLLVACCHHPLLPTSQYTLMQFPPFPGAHSCRGEVREGGGRAGRVVTVTLGRLSSAPP